MSTIGMEEPQRAVCRSATGDKASAIDVLRRVRATILLGGSTGWLNLSASLKRSVLDLPIDQDTSVIQQWQSHVGEMVELPGLSPMSVRLMIDAASHEPTTFVPVPNVDLTVEYDPNEIRGSGGVVHDISAEYDDDDLLLVASGGQVLFHPLAELVEQMAALGGDVCVVVHDDGTPSGLMLIRGACIRMIPPVGFVDMKEQALPRIAEEFEVNVLRLPEPSGMPLRTLDGYITAVRKWHLQMAGDTSWDDAFAERRPVFRIVESGADVAEDAELQDSVVLAGGRVESGAVVVRSIVSSRGTVPAGRMVLDQIVATGSTGRPGSGGRP